MTGTDQIFTPGSVANALVAAVSGKPRIVADFAAGEGALLAASAARWPDARHVALDVDPAVVTALKVGHADWDIHCGDFLAGVADIGALKGGVDLVLLNPPFSCRGSARLDVALGELTLSCSRAMAFICAALAFLSDVGELVAIVPASCLSSLRDAAVRAAIGQAFTVEVLQSSQSSLFQGCSVAVAQIRISRDGDQPNAWAPPPPSAAVHRLHAPYTVGLARGTLSVHTVKDGLRGAPFIHTTDLAKGRVKASGRRSGRRAEVIAGDLAILVPRVGRPDLGKLVLVKGPLVLSDCLFRLHTSPVGHEGELFDLLKGAWTDLEAVYGGSCAPYTTLAGICAFLTGLGLEVERLSSVRTAPAAPKPIATDGTPLKPRSQRRAQQ